MSTGMLWMAIGIAVVAWLPLLPSPALLTWAFVACAVLSGCLWRCRRLRSATRPLAVALMASLLGIVWGSVYGYSIRSGLLSAELEQQSLLLRGRVVGLV
ncbi:MAG TPA: hypothetical protein VFM32_08695, partial [Spongiibacteraceae bacterium]|nr:hypothetical protein [Spongiibacteraceae bacterium]